MSRCHKPERACDSQRGTKVQVWANAAHLAIDDHPGIVLASVLLHLVQSDAAPRRLPFQTCKARQAVVNALDPARFEHNSCCAQCGLLPTTHLPSLDVCATTASIPSGCTPSLAAPSHGAKHQITALEHVDKTCKATHALLMQPSSCSPCQAAAALLSPAVAASAEAQHSGDYHVLCGSSSF